MRHLAVRQPDRLFSQLWSFAYLVARRVLSLVVLVLQSTPPPPATITSISRREILGGLINEYHSA